MKLLTLSKGWRLFESVTSQGLICHIEKCHRVSWVDSTAKGTRLNGRRKYLLSTARGANLSRWLAGWLSLAFCCGEGFRSSFCIRVWSSVGPWSCCFCCPSSFCCSMLHQMLVQVYTWKQKTGGDWQVVNFEPSEPKLQSVYSASSITTQNMLKHLFAFVAFLL